MAVNHNVAMTHFRSSISLPRSSAGSARTQYTLPAVKGGGSVKYLTNPWSTARDKLSLLIRNGKDTAPDHPDSELDSGISVNGNYDQIAEPRNRKNAALSAAAAAGQGDYERIEEIRTLQSKSANIPLLGKKDKVMETLIFYEQKRKKWKWDWKNMSRLRKYMLSAWHFLII